MFIRLSTHPRPQRRRQAGDTIVEVLIAIAIVTLVLTGAYALSNHNVRAIQDNQEHNQAIQLVQDEIELLKNKGSLPAGSDCFMLVDNGSYHVGDAVNHTTGDCQVEGDGSANTGVEPLYTLQITDNSGTYSVQATWDNLYGSTGSVIMYYRTQ